MCFNTVILLFLYYLIKKEYNFCMMALCVILKKSFTICIDNLNLKCLMNNQYKVSSSDTPVYTLSVHTIRTHMFYVNHRNPYLFCPHFLIIYHVSLHMLSEYLLRLSGSSDYEFPLQKCQVSRLHSR